MDAPSIADLLKRAPLAAVLALACTAGGCCGNLLLSQRFGEPTCGVGQDAAAELELTLERPGIPVMAWPNITLPRCLHRQHWRKAREDFAESLQPSPPPPTKPPHSRFHPLPTQPVFAQRAEYAVPELLGVDPHQPHGEPLLAPPAEELAIPIPVPDAGREPTWHDLPAPQPQTSPLEEELLPPPEVEAQPPALEAPAKDASRGDIAPASYLRTLEPNPLRPISARR